MKTRRTTEKMVVACLFALSMFLLPASVAFGHCDSIEGPVIPEAKEALEKGDVTPILKWVKPEHEAEIRDAFAKAVKVRTKGPEAKDLADQYFLETLVRVHRAGEGAPYTGIKNEPVKRIVAMADKALADGSADAMIGRMSGHLGEAIREKFEKALQAYRTRDASVEAGREFVEAYVTYIHYVEGIHTAIMSPGGHHTEAGAAGHTE